MLLMKRGDVNNGRWAYVYSGYGGWVTGFGPIDGGVMSWGF